MLDYRHRLNPWRQSQGVRRPGQSKCSDQSGETGHLTERRIPPSLHDVFLSEVKYTEGGIEIAPASAPIAFASPVNVVRQQEIEALLCTASRLFFRHKIKSPSLWG
jgi:hypothetical protein